MGFAQDTLSGGGVSGGGVSAAQESQLSRDLYLHAPNTRSLYDFGEGSGTAPTNHSENATRAGITATITGSQPPTYDTTNQLFGDSCLLCGNSATSTDGYVDLGVATALTFGDSSNWECGFWYKGPASPPAATQDVIKRDNAGTWESGARVISVMATTGYVRFTKNAVGNLEGTTNVCDGNWHKIVLRGDHLEDSFSIIVDGKLDVTGTMTTQASNAAHTVRLLLANATAYRMQGFYYRAL